MPTPWQALRTLWRGSTPAPPASPPSPPTAPTPDTSFAARFRAAWVAANTRPVPTRAQIDQARAQHEAALARRQADDLIRQCVAGGGVLWRSDASSGPTLPGFGRMQSFEQYSKSTVLDP